MSLSDNAKLIRDGMDLHELAGEIIARLNDEGKFASKEEARISLFVCAINEQDYSEDG